MAQPKNSPSITDRIREAVKRHRAGALDEAAALYAEALAEAPNHADALHLSGLLAEQQDRHADAISAISRAIQSAPTVPDFYNSCGVARRASGDLTGAEADFAKAAALNPDYVQAWTNLGITRLQLRNSKAALAAFERAAKLAPNAAEIQGYLGTAQLQLGAVEAAIAALQRAVALDRNFTEAHYNLGIAYQARGDLAAAETAWRHSVESNPFYLKPWANLGVLLEKQGRVAEARACYERGLSHAGPDSRDAAQLLNNVGNLLDDAGEVSAAIQAFERAAGLAPDDPRMLVNLGTALLGVGALDAARAQLAKARALDPALLEAVYGDLLARLYADEPPAAQLDAAKAWAATIGASVSMPYENSRDPERRLRIGYVSPDFVHHVVARFIEPILGAHDPAAAEVYCYAEVKAPDEMTARFRQLAHHWRDTVGMDVRTLAQTIRADRIDILVDLAGHTMGSRLPVFAAKPAPIQMSWLGYPATTGLSQIDWRITDALADPPGMTEAHYTEQLLRLESGFNCYQPPHDAPDIAKPPTDGNGYVTFGSFNHAAKIRDDVLDLWAALLKQVPSARLLLKHRGFNYAPIRAAYLEALTRRGVPEDRVELVDYMNSFGGHLAAYNRIDIALDPFPYNGTTTTCEALWMGVPVVTLAGDTHRARVGASLLTRVGLPELIADSPGAYLAIAARLAGDRARLRELRGDLRQRVAASPLCDAAKLTREFEAALREAWRDWCRSAA
jgi:predicted O-linked N-acetylglucosamine transferase (SPINDLY family)